MLRPPRSATPQRTPAQRIQPPPPTAEGRSDPSSTGGSTSADRLRILSIAGSWTGPNEAKHPTVIAGLLARPPRNPPREPREASPVEATKDPTAARQRCGRLDCEGLPKHCLRHRPVPHRPRPQTTPGNPRSRRSDGCAGGKSQDDFRPAPHTMSKVKPTGLLARRPKPWAR